MGKKVVKRTRTIEPIAEKKAVIKPIAPIEAKKVAITPDKPVELVESKETQAESNELPVSKRLYWQKVGGASIRFVINGTMEIIKPNQKFFATVDEIPSGFKDMFIPLDEGAIDAEMKRAENAIIKTPSKKYLLEELPDGLWNVLSPVKKVMNEKPLTEEEAGQLITALNS